MKFSKRRRRRIFRVADEVLAVSGGDVPAAMSAWNARSDRGRSSCRVGGFQSGGPRSAEGGDAERAAHAASALDRRHRSAAAMRARIPVASSCRLRHLPLDAARRFQAAQASRSRRPRSWRESNGRPRENSGPPLGQIKERSVIFRDKEAFSYLSSRSAAE